MKPQRIQKVLARAGLGSRREIESWITSGRITVDRRTAQLGDTVGPQQQVCLDGKRLAQRRLFPERSARVIAFNKPVGGICTRHDPEGRSSVFDQLPKHPHGRWVGVGRLDINTSGLMLFTDDGELAHALMHPSGGLEREYAVRVRGEVERAVIDKLLTGVELEDGMAKFKSICAAGGTGSNVWYHVTLDEGRNREVRRLWESQGIQVTRLIRVRFGCIALPRRQLPGTWWELSTEQIAELKRGHR
jgi:23S rRNA pseudouridine2605 synthase